MFARVLRLEGFKTTRFFLCLILICLTGTVYAKEDCEYSSEGITLPKISNELIRYKKWSPIKKLFHYVTNRGETVYVRYWACRHFGMNADMIFPFTEQASLLRSSRILKLAGEVLNESDYKLLKNAIAKSKEVKLDQVVNVEGSNYSEFVVVVRQTFTLEVITISFQY